MVPILLYLSREETMPCSSGHQTWSRLSLVIFFGMVFLIPIPLSAQADSETQSAATPTRRIHQTVTNSERNGWFIHATLGAKSLGVGVASAGWGTWQDKPKEYDTHWGGFAKRYGM